MRKNVEWLVSMTTLSDHLRADAIRMAAAPIMFGRSENPSGSSGKDQPAIRIGRRVRPQQPQDNLLWGEPTAPAISAISIDP